MILKPTKKQKLIIESTDRNLVAYCGRRGGKTQGILYKAFLQSLKKTNQEITYVGVNYTKAKKLFYKPFLKQFAPYITYKNETDHLIRMFNGTEIYYYGGDRPDTIRGDGMDLALVDESSDQKEELYTQVLRPAVSRSGGQIILAGTPKGFDWVYDKTTQDNFKFVTWTTLEGGLVSKEEIEQAKQDLDERTFRQEYEASFENYDGIIAYNYSELNHCNTEYNPNLRAYLSFDFNVNPMSCVLIQRNGEYHDVVKEFIHTQSNTQRTGLIIKDFVKNNRVAITGDYSGSRSQTSSAGESDYDILYKIFGIQEKTRHPMRKQDQFNTLNSAFKTLTNKVKLRINKDQCPTLHSNLLRVTKQDYDKKDPRGLTHIVDALIYYAWNYLEIR
jgi:hypothetical protein